MNQLVDKWIFNDNYIAIDKVQFENYLKNKKIIVQGYLKDIMDDGESDVWRYPAYASAQSEDKQGTTKKIKSLATNCGNNDNDQERNFDNQVEEFRGMYFLCTILGYSFIGWDRPSGKEGINSSKNCDIALSKNGQRYYAEVKDCSGEVMSQKDLNELKKNPNDPINKVILSHNIEGVKRYKPKTDLNAWLREQIKKADDKGADILLCHFPWKGMPALTEQGIENDYADMMGNTVGWDSRRHPVLNDNITTNLSEIIVINKLGCWVIKVKRDRITYNNAKRYEPSI